MKKIVAALSIMLCVNFIAHAQQDLSFSRLRKLEKSAATIVSVNQNQYARLSFSVIKIDTLITHCILGKYNTPEFLEWDSATVWGDIIIPDLPAVIDPVSLQSKAQAIMKQYKLDRAYVFRNKFSSGLFRFSSAYAARRIKEMDGYLGTFSRGE